MRIDMRRGQWLGVAVIAGWMAVLVAVVPGIAASIPREEAVTAGQTVTSGSGTTSITPAEGWGSAKDAPKAMIILRKAGTQVIVFPSIAATTDDPVAILKTNTDPLKADPAAGWQVSEPTTFVTAKGDMGAYASGLAPKQFILQFEIVQNGRSLQVTATGTDTDWSALSDEIIAMVKTIEIQEVAQ